MVKPSTVLEENNLQIRRSIAHERIFSPNVSPVLAVGVVAATLSISSFLYFFANGMTNVYGDGVAHVNIARKVVDSPDDSLWQRYMQIGSPWLPLQTVLMLPLVANDWMWRTGAAGSALSMLSFVIAAVSLYLLARSLYRKQDGRWRDVLPLLSVAVFAINPSVLYMQSTPMTELVFISAMVTAVYFLQRWMDKQSAKHLVVAALAMTLATLARYEAWPVAALSIAIVALAPNGNGRVRIKDAALYCALTGIGPLYWLWHNWAIYGNALEFLTGPNSARGIYLQNRANLGWSKIFVGNAALDMLTIAMAAAVCVGPFVLLLGAGGFLRWLFAERKTFIRISPALLLLVPFFFHVLSLYRGEIQVFPLSVFGLHNVRYGLPHALAIALFAPSTVLLFKGRARRWACAAACLMVAAQYGYLISEGPSQLAVYQEGYRNGVNARQARERARVASFLTSHRPEGLVLMHTGALGPVVSQGGLRFSQTIHEGSGRWHQITDAISGDVSTVILQQNDPLDQRLRESPLLAHSLANEFEVRFTAGSIRILTRRSQEAGANSVWKIR